VNLARELAGSLGGDAHIKETHVSWVVIAGDEAFKLKKPVRFAFVDQSTPELRRALCEEEVRVNQMLAAPVVRGVAALVRGRDGLELRAPGAPGALDHVVAMRRFDDADTVSGRLASGRLTPEHLRRTAQVLAGFHAGTERVRDPEGPERRWRRNMTELAQACSGADAEMLATLAAFGPAFCRRWAAELARRADRGLVRDGHGDLRAEHVLIEGDRILVVDRLEFDPALRCVDVAEDLGFLTMDLERLGAAWAADLLTDAYRQAGGDPGPPALLAFFAAYRALVRAKVAALAGRTEEAGELVELAQRLSWRARRPLRLLVTGPPASGKSTVATAIAQAAGVPLFSSDVVRPREDGRHGRYDPDARARVYEALAASARRAESFVVDATFGDRFLQDAFFAAFGDAGQVAVVECAAPADVLAARAAGRRVGAPGASEAGPAVAAELLARFVSCSRPGVPRLAVDTTAPTRATLAHIAGWLDGQPSAGGGTSASSGTTTTGAADRVATSAATLP
jgi:aminoglycoside phosphotransferase family enzyme/predicted kinase